MGGTWGLQVAVANPRRSRERLPLPYFPPLCHHLPSCHLLRDHHFPHQLLDHPLSPHLLSPHLPSPHPSPHIPPHHLLEYPAAPPQQLPGPLPIEAAVKTMCS